MDRRPQCCDEPVCSYHDHTVKSTGDTVPVASVTPALPTASALPTEQAAALVSLASGPVAAGVAAGAASGGGDSGGSGSVDDGAPAPASSTAMPGTGYSILNPTPASGVCVLCVLCAWVVTPS